MDATAKRSNVLTFPRANTLWGILLLGWILCALAPGALAQAPAPNILVTLAPLDRRSVVELTALTVDAEISENDGHTIAQGEMTFKVHNTDKLNPTTLIVGFPEWAGANASFDPKRFGMFQVTYDDKLVQFVPGTASVIYGGVEREVSWHTFELTLEPDEKKTIRVRFVQDLGDAIFPRFRVGTLPGNRWKNTIGSARVTVKFPAPTTGEQFIALDPTLPQFDGQKLTWLWTNVNPEADPGVTFIRLSTWQTLLERRAAVAQNPDDANAHLALGELYRDLAAPESPRRDNFFAQAVAALEMAARLAPDNVRAVQTLAELYEERAGAPTALRETNYVALAMAQWQKLIGTSADAVARKQLAEDSFYLALYARGRGDYARALKLLDNARNFAPEGAGPLYTREHWANEVRMTHIAAARAALAEDDAAMALQHARAVWGEQFAAALLAQQPMFALTRVAVTTMSADVPPRTERKITLRLAPYPAPSEQAQQALLQVVATLNQTQAGVATLLQDATSDAPSRTMPLSSGMPDGASSYHLTLTVPFSDDADLKAKLTTLAQALPKRADWALVQAALAPKQLEWTKTDSAFSRVVHYRERVDLGAGQQAVQEMLNESSRVLGELAAASPDDAEAQLKLALLTHAQQWWYKALSSLVLAYELKVDGVTRTWSISLTTPRTLEYDAETMRPELYAVGALGAAGIFLLVVLALLALTRRLTGRERSSP